MKKSTLIAVAVFGVLIVAFAATRERQVTVGVQKLELPQVSADAFTELSFGALVLKKDATGWTVGNTDKRYAADESQVKSVAQALAELKAEDFVSARKDKHAELEVDAAKGLTVKASTATGVVLDLVLGKASRGGGAYLREAKSDAVFAINGSLPFLARRDLTSWRKKSIATMKADDVTKLTITPPTGAPWALVADSGQWKLEAQTPKDYRFDPAAALRLVSQLANLNAQEFAETPVEPPFTKFDAALKDGKTVTVRVGAKRPEGTYALQVDGDAQTYLLPAWQAEVVLKDPEGLRDLRLLHFELAQVEKLSLVTGGKKTVVTKEGEGWKLVEPKNPGIDFDAQQVTAQLTRLMNVRGTSLARDAKEPKASLELELGLQGGATRKLRVGELLAKGEDGLLYVINAADKSWLEQGTQLFKKVPPPQAQGFEQLPPEIRAQLEQQLRKQQR